jgi:hypothetical protein
MYKLTKKQDEEVKSLYEMISLKWHHTDSPNYSRFMQAHNNLPDYV